MKKHLKKRLSLYVFFIMIFNIPLHAQKNIVEKNGKYGVINENGILILKYSYDKISEYDEFGFYEVTRNDSSFLVNELGVEFFLVKEINKLTEKVEALDLNAKNLVSIPDEVFKFKQLKILCLNSNELDSIQSGIKKLQNLIYLDISRNNLEKLPSSIINLTKLEYLNLSDNLFLNFPETISQLSKLKGLALSKNKISILPPEIKFLKHLKILLLVKNRLKSISSELWSLENMETLAISGGLKDIPSKISNLSRLKFLLLNKNKFKVISLSPLVRLVHLRYLYLGENQITEIDSKVGKLKQLVHLNLYRNKLKRLPKEVSNLKNLEWIYLAGNNFSFWQKLRTKRLLPNSDIYFHEYMPFGKKK